MTTTPKANPFALLNLPIRFDLDAVAIERAYLAGLTRAHPDAGGDHRTGDTSTHGADAATLNKARKVLLDGEQRANALLEVLGGPAAADCKDLPDGFLMEMMTKRQTIEEEIEAGEDDSRANWERWARSERQHYSEQALALFEANTPEGTDEGLTQIRVLLNAWRYIERLIEQLDPEYHPSEADFR